MGLLCFTVLLLSQTGPIPTGCPGGKVPGQMLAVRQSELLQLLTQQLSQVTWERESLFRLPAAMLVALLRAAASLFWTLTASRLMLARRYSMQPLQPTLQPEPQSLLSLPSPV